MHNVLISLSLTANFELANKQTIRKIGGSFIFERDDGSSTSAGRDGWIGRDREPPCRKCRKTAVPIAFIVSVQRAQCNSFRAEIARNRPGGRFISVLEYEFLAFRPVLNPTTGDRTRILSLRSRLRTRIKMYDNNYYMFTTDSEDSVIHRSGMRRSGKRTEIEWRPNPNVVNGISRMPASKCLTSKWLKIKHNDWQI